MKKLVSLFALLITLAAIIPANALYTVERTENKLGHRNEYNKNAQQRKNEQERRKKAKEKRQQAAKKHQEQNGKRYGQKRIIVQ